MQHIEQPFSCPSGAARPLKVCIVAGEVSGDNLGAGLMAQLRAQYPHVEFYGAGGEKMRAQGMRECWYDISEVGYFGISNVIKNLSAIFRTMRDIYDRCERTGIDLYIGVDCPDFNLKVAHRLKNNLDVKTIQYVSPSIWAWRQGRVHGVKAATDLVLCLLPFEPDFYAQYQHRAEYVGHRLANQLASHTVHQPYLETALQQLEQNQTEVNTLAHLQQLLHQDELVQQHFAQLQEQLPDLNPDLPLVALLPGSRTAEIQLILPSYLAGIELAIHQGILPSNTQLALPVANPELEPLIQEICARHPQLRVHLIPSSSVHDLLVSATVALITSGTATLDGMLSHVPMVIGYRMNRFNYTIAKLLVKIKYVGLSNVVYGREQARELLQDDLTPENLVQALKPLLEVRNNLALRLEHCQRHAQMVVDSDTRAAQLALKLVADRLQQ